ncbi:ankyrin repeat domain-containing protein [Legionella genomosp. 1]|uniref:ankyrin repeat domain-containing protein n=1 Tax=Legionella genomosp. 1 TaxID=1093625 RepID=UPI001056C00D|nr:ankyrin repeat domain-containing protein [Legionella genomosp. 1]
MEKLFRQENSENLVAIAAKYGHFLIVYELLDRGISFRSKQGDLSLIHYAVIADEIAYLQEWLEEHAISDANVNGKSLAVFAAGAGSLRCLAYLLKQSKPTADEARQLIQACCENNYRSALDLVIPFIADINQTLDDKNNTALHCATRHGAVSTVQMLLGLGCHAQVRNIENQTPFHIAVLQEDAHLLKRLFKQTKPQEWPDDLSTENSSSRITKIIDKYRKRLPANLTANIPSDEKNQESNKKELRSTKFKPYIQNIQALLSNQAFDDAADLFEEQPDLIQIFNSEQGAVLFKSLFQSLYDLSDATTDAGNSHARLLGLLKKNKINPAQHLGKENVLLAIIRTGDENLACYRLNVLATYFPESLSLLANAKVSPDFKVIELALKLNKLKLFARLDEVCSDGLTENKHFSALHQAVLADSYGLVKTLLKRYSANVTNTRKQTPLMLAALKGNLRLMELLLLHGASVDSCDLEGQSALYYAILGKSEQAALTLLPLLRFPNQANRKGCTPLLLAAGQGLLAVVRYLCGQKNAMEIRDHLGRNALHYASIHGQVSVIAFLLQQKFAIDAREEPQSLKKIRQSSQRTPLHLAALAGKIEAVIKLVESGANPGLKCRFGKTVTEYAILSKSTPMLQLIQQLPFYHDEANDQSLIEAAAIGNHEEVMEELLLDGVNFNTLNEHGQNALHLAALSNAGNVAELLVNHEEIAIDLPDLAGNSPIHLAAHRGYVRILESLVNAGCTINKRNARQETALFIACEQGNLGAVCLLVKQGADTALANAQGVLPLQAAQKAGHKEIVDILQVLKPESTNSFSVLLKRFGLYQCRAPKPHTDTNYKEEINSPVASS